MRGTLRANAARFTLPAAAYAGVALAAVLIAFVVLDLRHADLRVPFCYSGSDCYNTTLAFAKNIQETGSIDFNPRVAAPLDHEYWRDPEQLGMLTLSMRFLLLFFRDFGTAVNVYFLLTFPLTAITALYSLRALGFSYFAAFVPALLYAFLPFHFWRGEDHILAASYFLIPLAATSAFWISRGEPLVQWSGKKWPQITIAGTASILFCVLLGSDYPYYIFFGMFLFALGAAYAWFVHRSRQGPLDAVALIAITALTSLLNLFNYLMARGASLPPGYARQPLEAEVYGLKIAQMLLPIPGHRVEALAQFRHFYDSTAPLVNENNMASLGAIGSLGFLVLIVVLLFPVRVPVGDVLRPIATFNAGCVLLATIGGFSTIFSYLVSPDLRAYNRIVACVGFFAFVAIAWLIEKLRDRFIQFPAARPFGVAGLVLVLCLGVADQTSPAMVPPYEKNASAYASDRDFVAAIERSLPAGAAIFQLPYVPFSDHEELMPAGISPYWLFKGYLHSEKLRWTYGAQNGLDDDALLRSLTALPTPRLLPKLITAGFDGIYLYRNAFHDAKAERRLEAALSHRLGQGPLQSRDGTLAFYSLEAFRKALISRLSESGFRKESARMPPLLIRLVSGCYATARSERAVYRWCDKHAVIAITNLTAVPKEGTLSGLVADEAVVGTIDVRAGSQHGQVRVAPKGEPMQMTLSVPPGTSLVEFDANLPVRATLAGPESFLLANVKLLDSATGDTTDFYNY